MTSPQDLLAAARTLLGRNDPNTAGLWPRAAALLARQALESALDAFWRSRGVALTACSTRAQLLCLRGYLKDDTVAAQAQQLWSTLSRACHHHPYELAPTVGELDGWLQELQGLATSTLSQEP